MNIKYKIGEPYSDDEVDESISSFVFNRLSNEKIADLVELLVVRGLLSQHMVFDIFKRTDDYLK